MPGQSPAGGSPTGRPPGGKAPDPGGRSQQGSSDVIKGLRVLLVEKDSIVALTAEDILLGSGASLVDTAASRKEALLHLEIQQYDLAIIDLKLPSDACSAIAARLAALFVPFAFAAEYGVAAAPPDGFDDRMVISKPYSESYLLRCLTQLLGGRG